MAPTEAQKDGATLHATDFHGDFSEKFIADVLEARKKAELGQEKRFDDVDAPWQVYSFESSKKALESTARPSLRGSGRASEFGKKIWVIR